MASCVCLQRMRNQRGLTTASATIRALRFLFATHGLPEAIVSENGPQDFLKLNEICHYLPSPYHPASNGEVQRALRTFKESMKTVKDKPETLADKLAGLPLSYWTTATTGRMHASWTPNGSENSHPVGHHASRFIARMSEKTTLGNHTTCRNFLPGDSVILRDNRDRK